MKKILILLLTLTMIVLSAVSCGGTRGTSGGGSDETEAGEAEPVPGVDGAAVSSKDMKIGVIYRLDPAEDRISAKEKTALENAADGLSVSRRNILEAFGEFADEAEFIEAVDYMAEKKCAVIFTADRSLMNYTSAAAEKYPDILFSNLGGYMTNGANFKNHRIRTYQAAYLCGMIAASRTCDKIGYIASGETAEDRACVNAFTLGAQAWMNALDTEASVYLKIAAPEEEQKAAADLIEIGCGFIGGNTEDSLYYIAPSGAEGEARVWYSACGADPDVTADIVETEAVITESETTAETVTGESTEEGYDIPALPIDPMFAANIILDTTAYYKSVIEAVMSGESDGIANSFGGFDDGEVSLESWFMPENDGVLPEAIDKVTDMLKNGSWDVFCGKSLNFDFSGGGIDVTEVDEPIYKNTGAQAHQTAYGSLDDGVIFETMDYYVYGVIESDG